MNIKWLIMNFDCKIISFILIACIPHGSQSQCSKTSKLKSIVSRTMIPEERGGRGKVMKRLGTLGDGGFHQFYFIFLTDFE